MKHFVILLITIFSFNISAYTQTVYRDTAEIKKNIAWFSPSKATNVNGVMFNVFPVLINEGTKNWPRINGLEIEICPLSIFNPFLAVMYSFDPETHQPVYDTIQPLEKSDFKEINGLHIGLGDIESKWVNGIDISATGSFSSFVNGASISLVMNKHYKINGLSLAAIGNHDIETNGVQIGLFNSSLNLYGVQFGLWNKNQKRSLPIINWVLKKQ